MATPERMTLVALQDTVDYLCLIPAHKTFVDALLIREQVQGRLDFLTATLAAYPSLASNHYSLAVRSSQIQSNPRVQRVLDLAFGRTPADPVMTTLRSALIKAIRHDIAATGTISEATAASLKVYERKTGKTVKVSRAK